MLALCVLPMSGAQKRSQTARRCRSGLPRGPYALSAYAWDDNALERENFSAEWAAKRNLSSVVILRRAATLPAQVGERLSAAAAVSDQREGYCGWLRGHRDDHDRGGPGWDVGGRMLVLDEPRSFGCRRRYMHKPGQRASLARPYNPLPSSNVHDCSQPATVWQEDSAETGFAPAILLARTTGHRSHHQGSSIAAGLLQGAARRRPKRKARCPLDAAEIGIGL